MFSRNKAETDKQSSGKCVSPGAGGTPSGHLGVDPGT